MCRLLALLWAPLLACAEPVTLAWDLDPAHDQATFEVEANGQILACPEIAGLPAERRCTFDLPVGQYELRLRAVLGAQISDWSGVVLAQVGEDGPGIFRIDSHFESEGAPSMPATPGSVLESGIKTANGWTFNVSFTAGRRGVIFLASAISGGFVSSHSASGGGVTWSQVGHADYGFRRGVGILLADGTPSGTVTVTTNVGGGGTYQETVYAVSEIADYQSHDTAVADNDDSGGGTSFNLPDIGTIDANDLGIAVFALEGGAENLSPATGLTELIAVEGGGNVRSLLVGYTTTDDTPGATWDNSGFSVGGVGFIVNGSAGAAAYSIDAAPGSFAITGSAATAVAGRAINAASGSYTITGTSATLSRGFSLNAEAGAYSINGVAATLLASRALSADPGSYSITGSAAGIVAARMLSADPGAYAISGVAAELVHGVIGAFSLNAEPGSFALSGNPAGLIAERILSADVGVYALTGVEAGLLAGRALVADPGAFSISAPEVTFEAPEAPAASSVGGGPGYPVYVKAKKSAKQELDEILEDRADEVEKEVERRPTPSPTAKPSRPAVPAVPSVDLAALAREVKEVALETQRVREEAIKRDDEEVFSLLGRMRVKGRRATLRKGDE